MTNKTLCFYDVKATSVSRNSDIISIGLLAVTERLNPKWKAVYSEWLMTHVDQRKPIEFNEDKILVETRSLYCEFTDYNIEKADDWVCENIIGKLQLDYLKPNLKQDIPINGVDDVTDVNNIKLLGTTSHISKHVKEWLSQFENPCFIADFDVIDKPMLIDLIADWDKQSFDEFGKKLDYRYCGKSHELRPYDSEERLMYYENQDGCSTYKVGLPKHLPNIRYDQFFDLHTILWMKGIDTDINREEFAGIANNNKHNALEDAYTAWECYKKLMKL